MYKVSNQNTGSSNGGVPEVDMDAPESSSGTPLILGISIEDATSVASRMSALSAQSSSATAASNSSSTALVKVGAPDKNQSLVLAQRIIKNAFNFLASFSGNVPVPGAPGAAGVEVVPLKAFEEWWRKFEGRVRNDPGFLERDSD